LPADVKETIFVANINKKFTFVDKHLKHHAFLSGDHFTLPDGYLFVILSWAVLMKFNLNEWPTLANYFNKLRKRKSIEKSLQEEKLQLAEAV
jgi:glutathione S-transferase